MQSGRRSYSWSCRTGCWLSGGRTTGQAVGHSIRDTLSDGVDDFGSEGGPPVRLQVSPVLLQVSPEPLLKTHEWKEQMMVE